MIRTTAGRRWTTLSFAIGVWVAPLAAIAHPAEDLEPGHWMELSLNVIDDVDPCPNQDCSWSAVQGVSAVIDVWNGGALASGFGTFGGLVVWGGGHNGYFGSELYVFDIETQLWIRYTEPYDNGAGSVASACNADGVYPDGSACPPHTYDRVDYHPATNSFVALFATTDPVCGGCDSGNAHLFSFDNDSWTLGGASPMPNSGTGASTAYDPGRDTFWLLPAYNGWFSQYDPNADSWTAYQQYNLSICAVSAIDPGRDLFVTVDGRGTQTVIVHDLADPGAGGVTVTVDNTSPVQQSGAHGFEWDPVSEQFVGWAGGPEVYALVPPAGDWATDTWTWLQFDPAADNAVVPTDPNSNGTYSRWRYVPAFNIFVVVNRVSDPVFAYRLSDEPGTGPNTDTGGSESGDAGTTSGSPSTDGGPGGNGNGDAGEAGDGGPGTTGQSGDSGGASDDDDSGCGCRSTPAAPVWAALPLLMLVRRRRGAGAPR